MVKHKVIIDCDPGHDDAIGIVLGAPHLDILGITCVGGNQTLEKVTVNALKIVEVIGRTDIPVVPGIGRPLVKAASHAPDVHGLTGMDGPVLPAPVTKAKAGHAVDFIIDTVMANDGVTLIPTGPLTNIAVALRKEPRIASRLQEISIMGGSATHGNRSVAAEFNIWYDPEAAHIVFGSGVPIKMHGLNLTLQVVATEDVIAKCRAIGNRPAIFVAELLDFFADAQKRKLGTHSGALHDPVAVAGVIDPTLFEYYDMHVGIELRGERTYGMTVSDMRHLRGSAFGFPQSATPLRGEPPNAQVGMKADAPRFFKLLYETLATYK
ncbi:MAG: nucleoside hydrolase [Chloroflexi bacterium]|nr:nucleoside hydrolase [Chloroflexota bacterium]